MSETSDDAMFRLDRVCKQFGDDRAVDAVSLAIGRNSVTALIGSSGSGKSTLLRLLIGLVWPDTGRVYFHGKALQRGQLQRLRQRIGYVIQEGGLFPHLTAFGNLSLLPRHLGWTSTRIAQRAEQLADLTHLDVSLLRRFPAELSGGQRQRVALMRALMMDPPVLLMDEPLGALDPVVRHDLQAELRGIFQRLDKTVVLVTHDMAEAAYLASRLVLLHEGSVLQDGSLEDFRQQPASAFVTRFLDSARALPEPSR